MSVHIPLPKARRSARVPAHIAEHSTKAAEAEAATKNDAAMTPVTDSGMRAPEKRFRGNVAEARNATDSEGRNATDSEGLDVTDSEGLDVTVAERGNASVQSPGTPSRICRAPFDPGSVPADALPLWNALREVMDPELPISVVDMGLIYDIAISTPAVGQEPEGRTVEVTLTYTATGCPCVEFIRTDIIERLLAEPGVEDVVLHEVWSPAWTRAMMTEEGRAALRELGVAA